jgi:hypothetical protein
MDKTGDWESIKHVILRYQKEDTLQYLFDCYTNLDDYPREIRSPYVCFQPKEQTGVLGVHVYEGENYLPPFAGESVMDASELSDYKHINNSELFYHSLYRFQIHD